MTEQLNKEVGRVWKLFHILMNEYNSYVDRELTLEENKKVKHIIEQMNMTFTQLDCAFKYILAMQQFSAQAREDWGSFVDLTNKDFESKNIQH